MPSSVTDSPLPVVLPVRPTAPPPQIAVAATVAKSASTAVLLELLPGLFAQTFGIGHLYAGRIGTGLILMFGYWLLLGCNLMLLWLGIGFITLPLCWIAALIIAPISAANHCKSD